MSSLLACCCAAEGHVVEDIGVQQMAPISLSSTAAVDREEPKEVATREVHVDKTTPPMRIGLDISAVSGKVLKIWKVKDNPPGLIYEWNKGKPEAEQVKSGDAIVEVNGRRGDSEQMLSIIAKEAVLAVTFQRQMFA
ncbi:unnamed protein product [Polarella glacialis]|uniref:PDZ domain-containing protein n=1 Tax=Polarella glacialis TaxID=89957 RepID=A0A813GIM4_POLGL|nr:unnamed protein product [Polarella glacialis]